MKRVILACLSVLAMAAVAAPPVLAQGAPTIVKEMVAGWQRAATDLLDVAEAMPEPKYDFKPTPDVATFRDQLVHVTGIVQRFMDVASGKPAAAADHHKAMAKAEVITLMKQTFQAGEQAIGGLSDGQLLEQVKFPFGDRMVTRYTYWQGPLYQLRNHHGQLVVYLRLNGIVPPTTARTRR